MQHGDSTAKEQPSSKAISIVIADDHAVVRLGVRMLLESQNDMELVAEAADGAEINAILEASHPDILLLDLQMPGAIGMSLLQSIRNSYPELKIIVFTIHNTEEDVYQTIRSGARGYLAKESPREEILRAIHDVHSGKRWIPPNIATRLLERIRRPDLTEREREILNLLVKGMSHQEISIKLGISERTAKNHTNHLLTKLGARNRLQAVHIALARGLEAIAGPFEE